MKSVFIDESGINKQEGVSTIAFVYLSTNNVLYLSEKILEIEKKLSIDFFKWSHTSWPVRKAFVEHLVKEEFEIKVGYIKNPIKSELEMYQQVYSYLIIEDKIDNIYIDGSKSKTYTHKIRKILKNRGIKMKQVLFVDDRKLPVLRLADFCAGLLRYVSENSDSLVACSLMKKIEKKIVLIFG